MFLKRCTRPPPPWHMESRRTHVVTAIWCTRQQPERSSSRARRLRTYHRALAVLARTIARSPSSHAPSRARSPRAYHRALAVVARTIARSPSSRVPSRARRPRAYHRALAVLARTIARSPSSRVPSLARRPRAYHRSLAVLARTIDVVAPAQSCGCQRARAQLSCARTACPARSGTDRQAPPQRRRQNALGRSRFRWRSV